MSGGRDGVVRSEASLLSEHLIEDREDHSVQQMEIHWRGFLMQQRELIFLLAL